MSTITTTGQSQRPSAPDAAAVAPELPDRDHRRPLFQRAIVRRAALDAVRKLDPRHQKRNPVMFVVEVGSALTLLSFVAALFGVLPESPGFIFAISAWLWFT